MGAVVLPFPTHQDRALIQEGVRARALGMMGEAEFSHRVTGILRSYGISQMVVDSFIVRDCGSFHTARGEFPIVAITAKKRSPDGACPACGSKPGRWLRGDKEIVVMCLGCGCVYSHPPEFAEDL